MTDNKTNKYKTIINQNKKVMKKILFFATALLALAGCTSNDYLGDETLLGSGDEVISFNLRTPALTRAQHVGGDAANDLNEQFVLFGYKTVSSTKQTVFNNYQVNYVSNTANTTTTNSANWEYVGYKFLSANMTGYTGVAGNVTTGTENDQTVKYWDYSATNYKFYAYSLGAGKTSVTPATYANASLLSTNDTYTLEGDQEQLAACYISDLKTVSSLSASTPKEVDLNFQSIQSKLQLGFYETIPGYSVKNIKFYTSASEATAGDVPTLYASSSILPKKGTYTVTFDATGKPQLAWAASATEGTQSNVQFSSTLTNYADKDYQEAAGNVYLGRVSKNATLTNQITVLPYANGTPLTLKVDYTLLSRDGSGETIEVKGATATVPAAYTQWRPNYSYTYLFKISDNTNGEIGGVTGLYPITLDAVVQTDAQSDQETITTVEATSITTYAKGKLVTVSEEYEYPKNTNIYIAVNRGTSSVTLSSSNTKLYTATLTAGAGAGATPAQDITEKSVANALVNGEKDDPTTPTTWTVEDANKWDLVVTKSNLLSVATTIPAADSPTGVDLTINGAVFKPTTAGTYVFEYIKPYVPGTPATYYEATDEAVINGTKNVGDLKSSGTPSQPEEHHYKVIRVK